ASAQAPSSSRPSMTGARRARAANMEPKPDPEPEPASASARARPAIAIASAAAKRAAQRARLEIANTKEVKVAHEVGAPVAADRDQQRRARHAIDPAAVEQRPERILAIELVGVRRAELEGPEEELPEAPKRLPGVGVAGQLVRLGGYAIAHPDEALAGAGVK